MADFQCWQHSINRLLRPRLQGTRDGGRWQQKGRREAGLFKLEMLGSG
jgi:hypothetical protein